MVRNCRFGVLLCGLFFVSGCATSPVTSETAAGVRPSESDRVWSNVSRTVWGREAAYTEKGEATQAQEGATGADLPTSGHDAAADYPHADKSSAVSGNSHDNAAQGDNPFYDEKNVSAMLFEDENTKNIRDEHETSGTASPEVDIVSGGEELTHEERAMARRDELVRLRTGTERDFAAFWAQVDADPLLTGMLDEEVRPHGTNSISALGGGSTVSFKYIDTADESSKAALKPDQDLRQTMYRSEIAYYRLCQILECSFDVPVTRPARFSQNDFNALYNASSSPKNKGYRTKFDHLIWKKENNSKYLYVAYKEWISPFEGFPIEASSVWSPYLQNPNIATPELSKFMRHLLIAGRPADSRKLTTFMGYSHNMTTRDLLRQLSDLILIDFLTNNWDRFSGDVTNYGANCHYRPGGIIAIDNGASFPPWHAPRVVRRLHMVRMFSKDLVENLRMFDPDELLIRLFPNPTKEERKSFDRFKERRLEALKYIDELIAKSGEGRVLVF